MKCVVICFLFLLKTISTSNTIENTVATTDDTTSSTKNQERSVRYANGQDVGVPIITAPHAFVPNTNYYHNPQATIPQQPQVYDGNYNRYQPSYEEELKQEVNSLKEKISGMHNDILTSLQQSKQPEYQNDDHKNTYQPTEQSHASAPVQYDQQQHDQQHDQTHNFEQPSQQRTFGLFNHLTQNLHQNLNRGLPFVAPAQTVLYETVPVRTIQRKLLAPGRRVKVIREKGNGRQNIVRRKITRVGGYRSVEVAERAIDSIKKSMYSAIWTGITVVAVKLAPILILGLKLLFKSFLPIIGLALFKNRSFEREIPEMAFEFEDEEGEDDGADEHVREAEEEVIEEEREIPYSSYSGNHQQAAPVRAVDSSYSY